MENENHSKELEYLGKGDVQGLLRDMQDTVDPAILENVKKSIGHLSDPLLYRKMYGYSPSKVQDYPQGGDHPYHSGKLDRRQLMVLDLLEKQKLRGSHLDLASSDGMLLLTARMGGITSMGVGVELSTTRVQISENNRRSLNVDNVVFLNGMVEDVPLFGQFDYVTAGEVLEHVMDPLVFLRKAASFLKPDGILITTVPIDRPPLSDREKSIELSSAPREHVRYLNRGTLESMALEVGMTISEHYEESSGWKNLISVWKSNAG